MYLRHLILSVFFLGLFSSAFSQRGKNGIVVFNTSQIVNLYTTLAVDATAGMNFIGNLTDEKVKQLYLQSPKISEEIKKIIRTM